MKGGHGKRLSRKLKIMAKLGENLYRTTKVFRFCNSRVGGPKAKWGQFLQRNQQQMQLWKEWWDSPQADRWKALGKPKAKPAESES